MPWGDPGQKEHGSGDAPRCLPCETGFNILRAVEDRGGAAGDTGFAAPVVRHCHHELLSTLRIAAECTRTIASGLTGHARNRRSAQTLAATPVTWCARIGDNICREGM